MMLRELSTRPRSVRFGLDNCVAGAVAGVPSKRFNQSHPSGQLNINYDWNSVLSRPGGSLEGASHLRY
jgi:hypothetical protein